MFDKDMTMDKVYGTREIIRNPSLLRIEPNESFIVEDKKCFTKGLVSIWEWSWQRNFSHTKRNKNF